MISTRIETWLLVSVLLAAGGSARGQGRAEAEGETQFRAHCARCHGVGGTGGEGPSLNRPVLRHAADDAALATIISNGIEGTGMPGTWMLSEREVESVARYVRSLGRLAPEPITGDPDRGRELYEGRGGCAACHVVAGEGGILGPSLDGVGSLRGAAYLRESLLAPGEVVAPEYVVVSAVTSDGREVVGARVNEDSFTVQVRDSSGRFHSFDKRSLSRFEKRFGESLMPGYESELTRAEIEDVVAYLASLKVEP